MVLKIQHTQINIKRTITVSEIIKEFLTDEDRAYIAKQMKRIMVQCDYRHSELYSLEQQKEYLSKLDAESLEEISEQILMYKKAREYHAKYVYRK